MKVLEQLQKDEIIDYVAQHSDIEITFLVPREDDSTINVFAKKVKERHALKVDKLNHMLDYVNNKKVCRNKQLLKYFGETAASDCGICDCCLDTHRKNQPNKTIIVDMLELLKKKNSTSREIIENLCYSENVVLSSLQELLEDGKIRINTLNQYELITK